MTPFLIYLLTQTNIFAKRRRSISTDAVAAPPREAVEAGSGGNQTSTMVSDYTATIAELENRQLIISTVCGILFVMFLVALTGYCRLERERRKQDKKQWDRLMGRDRSDDQTQESSLRTVNTRVRRPARAAVRGRYHATLPSGILFNDRHTHQSQHGLTPQAPQVKSQVYHPRPRPFTRVNIRGLGSESSTGSSETLLPTYETAVTTLPQVHLPSYSSC